ncbi:CVNH domain-containing protein [Aspergillus homomorphus CBS 101889]|uniref:Cyanovirin-N n=1 Tax=Aspergillus homomorphus (strain CBS 101889) TaxID=1450537 RepID=A0A395HRH4_ASPHC|nr:Cyanovirin-N [Aspergillus homomorphus CBS 101889]RAL08844.1 Cyanovirin-N [Aspergillus homomorphus CBS 101889]
MSFAESCTNIRLEDGHVLVCHAQNREGNWVDARLDLDHCIGNSDGWFMWDGVNFAQSANNITLEGTHLTADLPKRDGGYRERQGINLGDRIGNVDGRLVFN